MRSETIDTRSRTVRYWRGGAGAPMVLLQGGMGDAELHWSRLWDRLCERFEVFAPDLPGFGRSAALPGASFPALAAWLDDFHLALRFGAPVVIGADLGGSLARTYAATYPLGCRKVAMIGGGGLPTLLQRVGARLTPPIPAGGGALFSRPHLAEMVVDPDILTDAFVAACRAGKTVAPMMRRLARGPAPKRRPHAPALVLWGERDRIVPAAVGEHIAAEMPGAVFRLLRGCGHLPHIEAPAATADALGAFLL